MYRCSYVLSHRTRETSQRRVSKSANSWKYRVCSQFFYLLSVLKRANKNTDHGGFLALRARSPTVTSLAPPSNSYAPLGTDRLKNSPLDAPVPVTYTGSAGNISNQMKPFNFFSRQNYYFPGVCFVVKNKVQLTCSVVFTTLKNKSLYRVFSLSWLASIRAFTKEKSFNSNRIGLGHQYGCCDVM